MNPVRLSSLLSPSRSRIVWGRRNLFVAAGALLWGLSGCTLPEEGDPGVTQGRQVRTAFQMNNNELAEPLGVFVVLDETPNVAGLFEGTLTLSRYGHATSLPVAATLDRDSTLHVSAHEDIPGYRWDELRIELRDANGDGIYESGSGHMVGAYNWSYDEDVFEGDFEAAPDAFQVTASARPDGDFSSALLPWQPLVIELGQPVPVDHIWSFVVLADGEPVDGRAVVAGYQLYETSVQFVPEAFYPPGSELRVVPMGMQNALGTQVEGDGAALPVIADVGPASVNLGFEQGLAGWSTVGNVAAVASHGDAAPVEGTAMAVLRSGFPGDNFRYDSRLVGYLDVPEDASELDLSLEVMSEDQLPAGVTVRLYRDDSLFEVHAFEIYEFEHEAEGFAPCDCTDLGLTQRTGPLRRQVSLAGFRGERVFLELRLDTGLRLASAPPEVAQALGVRPLLPPAPPTIAALVVDDIQIR